MNDPETFLTQAEAAEVLRLSERTLERYRQEASGPRFARTGPIGRQGKVLYKRSDIDAWIAERTFESTSQANAAAA